MNRTFQFLILSALAFFAVTISFDSVRAQNPNAMLNQIENRVDALESDIENVRDLQRALQDEVNGLNRQGKVNSLTNQINGALNSMNGQIQSMVNLAYNLGNAKIIDGANQVAALYSGISSSSIAPSSASLSLTSTSNTELDAMAFVMKETIRREIQIQR